MPRDQSTTQVECIVCRYEAQADHVAIASELPRRRYRSLGDQKARFVCPVLDRKIALRSGRRAALAHQGLAENANAVAAGVFHRVHGSIGIA
jgi:hypothetical protein